MFRLNELHLGLALFAGVALLTLTDLLSDLGDGVDLRHAAIEGLVILLCFAGTYFFMHKIWLDKKHLGQSLDKAREDLSYWKRRSSSFIQGLAAEIEKQFEEWNLTKSEKEIALFLIKGFATKEIAQMRNTTEKTVRVQTSSIYKKAKVSNRNELTAFFLEDLLLPLS